MLLVLSYKDHSIALAIEVILGTEHTVKVGHSYEYTSSNSPKNYYWPRKLLASKLLGLIKL